MARVICKWLNLEVRLSKNIDSKELPTLFSNGMLFGEILWRYGIIKNMDAFADDRDEMTVRRNFNLLVPAMQLLGINLTVPIAKEIQEERGTAVLELLYSLFVAIESRKVQLQHLEPVKPLNIQVDRAAALKQIKESLRNTNYSCRRLQELLSTKQAELKHRLLLRQEQMTLFLKERSEKASQKVQQYANNTKSDAATQATKGTVEYCLDNKPSSEEAKKTIQEISEFEKRLNAPVPLSRLACHEEDVCVLLRPVLKQAFDKYKTCKADSPDLSTLLEADKINFRASQDYIDRIRHQLSKEVELRLKRQQRNTKIIEEHTMLFHGTEREQIEELMINVLLRRSKFERRAISELMQLRQEKAILLQNRYFRAKQMSEMREKNFQNALDADMRQLEANRFHQRKQIQRDWEFHKLLLQKRAEQCYRKNYELCWEIALQIVDMAICAGTYLELHKTKIPRAVWRDWRVLFCEGKPFFAQVNTPEVLDNPWELDIDDIQREDERQDALDSIDFKEYLERKNDWCCQLDTLWFERSVLGHVVYTLLDQVYPFPPPVRIPEYPCSPCRACVLGKPFLGKSALIEEGSLDYPVRIVKMQRAIEVALQAHRDFEEFMTTLDTETGTDDEKKTSDDANIIWSSGTVASTRATHTHRASDFSLAKKLHSNQSLVTSTSEFMTDYVEDEGGEEEEQPREMSPLVVLGYMIWDCLKEGREIEDSVLVKTVLEVVRSLPDGVGWILDSFPLTIQQAKLLDQGLTAYYTPEDMYNLLTANQKEPNVYELRSSNLIENPDPVPLPPLPKSPFDFVVYLDATDELVLELSSIRTSSTEFEVDFNHLSIHHQLKEFNEQWPELEKWYTDFGVLVTIPYSRDDELARLALDELIRLTLSRNIYPCGERTEAMDDHFSEMSNPNEKGSQFPSPPSPRTNPTITQRLPAGNNSNFASSMSRTGVEHSMATTNTEFGGDNLSVESGEVVVVDLTEEVSEDVLPVGVVTPVEPTSLQLPAKPGDLYWEFVENVLPLDTATALVSLWQCMEINYTTVMKTSFRKLRQYREAINTTFYNLQQDYLDFLKRPDEKQVYVTKWQEQYNSIAADMRSDFETKAEFHKRVDELRHILWELCDCRLDEGKHELSNIMTSGWFEDWLGLIINRFIILMQAELDRFHNTMQMLKDYYDCLEFGHTKEGDLGEIVKLPLIEMLENFHVLGPRKVVMSDTSMIPSPEPSRIPHMYRIEENIRSDAQANGKKSMKSKEGDADFTVEDFDALLGKAYEFAVDAVDQAMIVAVTLQGEELTPPEEEIQADKNNKQATKAQGINVADDLLFYISPEILQGPVKGTEPKEKVRLEYWAAVAEEESRVRTCLSMLHTHALEKLEYYQMLASEVYGGMDIWLGTRFNKEIESIDILCKIIVYAIEDERKIQEELVLKDDTVFIDVNILLFPTPAPEIPLPGQEKAYPDHLTVNQMCQLAEQFRKVASAGWITTHQFEGILSDLLASGCIAGLLPEDWYKFSSHQVHELVNYISGQRDHVNWRRFLLYAAKPWPNPTTVELIKTLDQFRTLDTGNISLVSQEQFDKVEFWFGGKEIKPVNPYVPRPYDRLGNLKKALFTVFQCDVSGCAYLDYTDLLINFSSAWDTMFGFTRALSVACSYPITPDNETAPQEYDQLTREQATKMSADFTNSEPILKPQKRRSDLKRAHRLKPPTIGNPECLGQPHLRRSAMTKLAPSKIKSKVMRETSKLKELYEKYRMYSNIFDRAESNVGETSLSQAMEVEDCLVPFSAVLLVFLSSLPLVDSAGRLCSSEAGELNAELMDIYLQLKSFNQEPVYYSDLINNPAIQKKIKEASIFLLLESINEIILDPNCCASDLPILLITGYTNVY